VGSAKIMFKKKKNWIDELEVWVLMQLGWVGKKIEKMKLVKAWFGQPTSHYMCTYPPHSSQKRKVIKNQ
jgi:hypothetical protein